MLSRLVVNWPVPFLTAEFLQTKGWVVEKVRDPGNPDTISRIATTLPTSQLHA